MSSEAEKAAAIAHATNHVKKVVAELEEKHRTVGLTAMELTKLARGREVIAKGEAILNTYYSGG